MTLVTNKSRGDTVEAYEWNEAATASNKVTDQTLVAADISDFDTEVTNNATVVANTAKVGVTTQISDIVEDTTPQLGGNLDCNSNDIDNLVTADFAVNAIGNSGASNTINMDNGGLQTITLDQNTSLTVSATKHSRCSLIISGGGSFTITWTGVTWLTSGGTAPTLDGNDVVTLVYDGTNIWGQLSNQS